MAICNQKSDKEINKSENEFLICNEHTVIDFDKLNSINVTIMLNLVVIHHVIIPREIGSRSQITLYSFNYDSTKLMEIISSCQM